MNETRIGGLFYRKGYSLVAIEPAILKLENGVLSASDATTELFSVPVQTVQVSVTPFMTLLIKTSAGSFRFFSRRDTFSDNFTDAQMQQLGGSLNGSMSLIVSWISVFEKLGVLKKGGPRSNSRALLSYGVIFAILSAIVILAYAL